MVRRLLLGEDCQQVALQGVPVRDGVPEEGGTRETGQGEMVLSSNQIAGAGDSAGRDARHSARVE